MPRKKTTRTDLFEGTMNSISGLIPVSMFAIVMLGWFGFAAIFLFRQKPPKTEEQKRDRASIIGIVLQGIAYTLI